ERGGGGERVAEASLGGVRRDRDAVAARDPRVRDADRLDGLEQGAGRVGRHGTGAHQCVPGSPRPGSVQNWGRSARPSFWGGKAAGPVLRVEEGRLAAAADRRFADHAESLVAQALDERVETIDVDREVVKPLAPLCEEARDGAIVARGLDQLDLVARDPKARE